MNVLGFWAGGSAVPVGAPRYGGHQAGVGEQDVVVLDAVQSVVHLTQRQPVQLELELHLRVKHNSSFSPFQWTALDGEL